MDKKSKSRFLVSLGAVLMILLLTGACGQAAPSTPVEPESDEETAPAATEPPAPTEEAEEKPYAGVTLTCLSDSAWWSETFTDETDPETGMTLIEQFEAETGAKVTVDKVPYVKVREKASLELSSGSDAYDCFMISIAWSRGFENAGYLEPFPKAMIEEMDFEDFQGNSMARNPDGNVYFLPYLNETDGIFIRTDLFEDPEEQAAFEEEYGYPLAAPRYFSQLVDMAEFFHRPPELYGASYSFKAYGHMPYLYFGPRMYQFGMDAFGENLKPQFNNEEGLKALNNLVSVREYTHEEACTWAAEGNVHFLEGHAAIYERWTNLNYYLNNPETSKIRGDFQWVPMPTWEEGGAETRGAMYLPWGWTVSAYSKNKEAALDLAAFLTSKESQLQAARFGNASARLSAISDSVAQERHSYLKTQYEIAQNAKWYPIPLVPEEMTATGDILGQKLHQAICGMKEPKDALQEAEEEVQELRAELGYE